MFPGQEDTTATIKRIQAVRAWVRAKYLAIQLFLGANPCRYGKLLKDTENKVTGGNKGAYPTTVNQAYEMIVWYKKKPWNHQLVATKD